MINLINVSKSYTLNDESFECLKDMDLHIQTSTFSALCGKSGCGKSTLFNLLSGLDTSFEGVYQFEKQDVSALSEEDWLRLRRTKIGTVFQNFNLISTLTVEENVRLGADLAQKECSRKHLDEVLSTLGLLEKKHSFPSQLSRGEQQRTAIARVLMQDPDLILADEPTGNLDPASSETVFQLLCALHEKGKTILLITHDPDLAARTEKVLYLQNGKIAS